MNNELSGVEVVENPAPTVGQAQPKALDFEKIDSLRKHILLNVNHMAKLLGTTRVSYYNWKSGGKLHKKNADRVRRIIRGLAYLAAEKQWPNDEAYQADQPTRLFMLQEMLAKLEQ